MARVAIKECSDYQYETVLCAVRKAIELLGGAQIFFQPKKKVLLKPNLLRRSDTNQCIVTHPMMVKAVAQIAIECGAAVTIADSPGGPYTKSVLESLYKQTGYDVMAKEVGAVLNTNCDFEEVAFAEGKFLKHAKIIKPVIDADVIVNMPKLKTHGLTGMSGAVKNLYGTVAGLVKAEYHMRFSDMKNFCGALVDIAQNASPQLTIVDSVWAMQGQGPGSAGEPKFVGAILAGQNIYAIDTVCAKIIGLKEVLTIKEAMIRGYDTIPQMVGDEIENFIKDDYKHAKTNQSLLYKVPKLVRIPLEKILSLRPIIDSKACILCGVCVRCCPAKAMSIQNRQVGIDYKKCVNCFCCHELCPQKAVKIKRSMLLRLLQR
ncbi:MAG: DUF362 domain-containing protein [Christensenellaceae bacterium]